MSTGGKGVTPQPVTEQPRTGQEQDADLALVFASIEEMKLNIPFVLPEDINEGKTEEEAKHVRKVLEKAHLHFLGCQKSVDDNIRRFREEQGKTYTLVEQLKALGSAVELWMNKVQRWQEEEKWARTADPEELAELQKTNPLVRLFVQEPAPAPGETTKKAKAVRRGEKRKKVVVSESEEEEEREEEAEEEQQLYVTELDTYVPVDLGELTLGDPAENEQPMDSPIKDQGVDDYLAMAVVPVGVGEQVAPAKEEETEQEEETQLLVYRRRNRRRGMEEVPVAPGGGEYGQQLE